MTPLPLALLLLGPLLFRAQSPPPPPELLAGVQFTPMGDFAGAWQTAVVDLDSRTRRELDLTIRIEDDSFLTVTTRRELLGPGARKRVFLYAPAAGFQRGLPARYRITDSRGSELAAGQLPNSTRGLVADGFQIGLYCRIPAAEDDFAIPTSLNNHEVRCGRLSSATFPDRWIGLLSLDLVIIHDAPLDELTVDQARALQDYVRYGGTVLLIPGASAGWFSHPVIQSIAPIRTGAPSAVGSAPGLSAGYGALRVDDPFLAHPLLNGVPGLDGIPAEFGRELVKFDTGIGRVLVLGVDLRRAPFDTWAGRRPFWNNVLNRTPRWFEEDSLSFPVAATQGQRDELFQRMARLINPYPSFGLILGLAVVFLGVVGPLNYAVLWRLRRTLLLVVTVPGISVGFLAVIVLLGYLLKGTSTVAHSARLLSTRSGLGVARETHLYSLFSPATRTYDVTFEPGSYGPFDRWNLNDQRNWRRRQEVLNTISIENGSTLSIRGVSAGQWQSWDLESRALRELGKGVRFTVEDTHLKIQNGSSRVIERGLFIQTGPEGTTVPFSLLEAGRSFEAPLGPARQPGSELLAFAPDSLGSTLLRPWLDTMGGPNRGAGAPRRFLICVLRNEGTPVTVDARLSGRSQSITLLHVAEAP
ncbi:MAG TPA: hypothetical protein VMU54_05310 [Planctomycetota bacterium]|nr:hypothetical protein [Planctomycetota bacterium]